jgi:FkbM family methyltransferase
LNALLADMTPCADQVFKEALKNIAETHGGVYLQRAAWIKSGQTLTFHAHADAGGMGSSLFGDSVYSNGFCDGNVSCHFPDSATSMAQKYEVETVDVVELVQAVARPHDVVVLRMDIEGAEYEVVSLHANAISTHKRTGTRGHRLTASASTHHALRTGIATLDHHRNRMPARLLGV